MKDEIWEMVERRRLVSGDEVGVGAEAFVREERIILAAAHRDGSDFTGQSGTFQSVYNRIEFHDNVFNCG